ncbi:MULTISPECIES: hypothetical protein [Bordetella]|uniref:hypothetical protein n=1 Tax=Bordetella TaxID=517 RepID=UPI0011C0824B|nr:MULTISPECIES: hypothetical protein [Bordetella]QGB67653.1 hypothetical protein FYB42_09160 [Bordetella parapertussis]
MIRKLYSVAKYKKFNPPRRCRKQAAARARHAPSAQQKTPCGAPMRPRRGYCACLRRIVTLILLP